MRLALLFVPLMLVACTDSNRLNRLPNSMHGLTRFEKDGGALVKAMAETVDMSCRESAKYSYTETTDAAEGIAKFLKQNRLMAKDMSRGARGAFWIAGEEVGERAVLLGIWSSDGDSRAGELRLCLLNNG
ncbi:hypothetical protein [Deinococcus sp. UYEF24]